MEIEQIVATFPSRKVSNADILSEIKGLSLPGETLDNISRQVRLALVRCGSKTRYWCTPDETPLDLTMDACRKALNGLEKCEKVDCLIYASVYPFLTEPASANLIAHELGLDDVECFDLKEACDGWAKAAKLAYVLINSGMYQRIMVVNAEFSLEHGYALYPDLFTMTSADQLEYRFPAFTIGEVATATIFGPSNDQWQFENMTRNDLYDLCTVTPTWYGANPVPSARVAKDGPGRFTSWASTLSGEGIPLVVDTFDRSGIRKENVDILFTHGSSKRDWSKIAEAIGLSDKLYDMHEGYGNVVSAAIPAAMALALAEGSLKRGDRVVALVGSAGMSFSVSSFVF